MTNVEIIMPALLLIMSYLLKIFVDRSASLPDALSAFLELPVDVTFLATSLIVGFSLVKPENSNLGFVWFFGYLIGAFIVVILWRRSTKLFQSENYYSAIPLVMVNYAIVGWALINAIELVSGGTNG